MSSSHDADKVVEGLRERAAANAGTRVEMRPTRSLPEDNIPAKDRHTFGRTSDGTVFIVPVTHDMVSQLFDPRQPRNLSDYFVITVLALHVLLLYALPTKLRGPIFAIIFLFWRACYNGGIGYLLQIQSHHRRLVTWAKSYKIFEIPSTGKNPRPWLYNLIKREVEAKISDNYKFDEAPIEYNTWLVFRRFVDLILMCDFTSYCLLAIAYGKQPTDESTLMLIARWVCGLILIVFNLWVKLDAHRVVKDYAWYWGDFFYLIDQDLTFDGVYDIAPHPMYSVGYAGYYGISMLAASYNLLFISILAHAAQFAFLVWIENPHIEKTYNPPAPRKRVSSHTPAENLHQRSILGDGLDDQLSAPFSSISNVSPSPSPYHKLLGWQNFDPFRNTDVCVILLLGYVAGFALFTPDTLAFRVLFVLHAVAWRLWYTVGLGIVLGKQSNKKSWTRHFLKHGESVEEAWRQWKGIYYMSMAMCWASFVAATWKMYSMPEDWGYGLVLLKHVLGVGLVVLQIWTAASIYDSLGEFGWFFGDFFFDHAPKLTYSGIYRYLNNPERILGLAGVWGAVFITRSQTIFFLALLSHTLTLASIQFVERPHMDKLYGQSLRKEAGLTKSIKRSLPPPFQQWQGNVDRVFQDTGNFFEEFIDAARPKLAAGVSTFVKDTSALFSQYPARLTITRLAPDLAGFKPKDYSLKIEGTSSVNSATTRTSHGLDEAGEHTISRPLSPGMDFKPLNFEYGAPITVEWTAPVNHSKKDWIGLYMVVDNNSRSVSRISSAGRWIPTTPNEYDSSTADSGILVADVPVLEPVTENDGSVQRVKGRMQFAGDKLWWTHGVYEFRYHHDGKHNVMAISSPFEIRIPRFDEESLDLRTVDLRTEVECALLPVVQNCFDRDPEIAPKDAEEVFGEQVQRDSKYAKRVVFAVSQMFGVEFASSVVLVDGCVKNLAWRICNAKEVLAPYSMDRSNGTTTPIGKD